MMSTENTLSSLPNIGKVLANKLLEAGIESPEQLRTLGSSAAFIRLKTIDPTVCYNMLCAIEGAIQNCRWHSLDKDKKQELKDIYASIKISEK